MARFQHFVVALLLLSPLVAFGQYTSVSGQILDPAGTPYRNASVYINFVAPASGGPPTLNGQQGFQQSYSTSADGNGNFSQTLPDNNQIVPAGSQWTFNICSLDQKFCFAVPAQTITGVSQSLTSVIQANSLAISTVPGGTVLQSLVPSTDLAFSLGNSNHRWNASLGTTTTNGITDASSGGYNGKVGATTPNTGAFTTIASQGISDIGTSTVGSFNTVLYPALCANAAHPSWCSGTDIGGWSNAAYLALPSTGGHIHIGATSGCLSYTTPMVFGTNLKPVLFDGDGAGATCIKYTPTTGTAITLDYGTKEQVGQGIRDIQIIGPGQGTAAVGILVGSTNGAEGSFFSNIKFATNATTLDGFGTNIQHGNTATTFLTTFQNIANEGGGTCFNIPNGTENIKIVSGFFSHCTTPLNVAASGTDVFVYGASFDDNTGGIAVSGGVVRCFGCHYENVALGAGAAPYVSVNNGQFWDFGGYMVDDRTVGTNANFVLAGGLSYVGFYGTAINTLGITVTQAVNFSGSARGVLNFTVGSANISADYNTAYAGGPVFDEPFLGTGGTSLFNLNRIGMGFTGISGLVGTIPWQTALGSNAYSFVPANPTSPLTVNIKAPFAVTSSLLGLTLNTTFGIDASVRAVAGCTTGNTIGAVCASPITVTWPNGGFGTTNYSAGCNPIGAPTNLPSNPYSVTKTNTTTTFNYYAITAAAASWGSLDCWAKAD